MNNSSALEETIEKLNNKYCKSFSEVIDGLLSQVNESNKSVRANLQSRKLKYIFIGAFKDGGKENFKFFLTKYKERGFGIFEDEIYFFEFQEMVTL